VLGVVIDLRSLTPASSEEVSPALRVAGLSLIERAVRIAVLVEARCVVVGNAGNGAEPTAGLGHELRRLVTWVDEQGAAAEIRCAEDVGWWWIYPCRTVVDLTAARAMAKAAGSTGPVSVLQSDLLSAGSPGGGAHWLLESGLAADLMEGKTDYAELAAHAGMSSIPLPTGAVCVELGRAEDAGRLAVRLLAVQGAETDGWVDRVFNRHLSRAFSRVLLPTPATPDQVTLLHTVVGLGGAVAMASEHYWSGVVGALLFQLSVALDCTDGEIARLKLRFSRWGGLFDTVGDNVVHAAVFAAIGVSARRALGGATAGALAASAGAGIAFAFALVWLFSWWHRRRALAGQSGGTVLAPVSANLALIGEDAGSRATDGSPGQRRLDAMINQVTSRDFSVLVVGAALFGHLEWMLWMAGIGIHVFWIGFTLLQVALITRSPRAAAA
jgi:phosphatidylglycerophosphate synthase